MATKSDRVSDLLLGERRGGTGRALILASGFVLATMILEYLLYVTAFENSVIKALHQAFLLDGFLPTWHATGAFIVVGLAALHAYLNEGYLPSVVLGWGPAYGNVMWTIGSLSGVENYYLDPLAAFQRTFPEAAALATVGFIIGLGVRWGRMRQQHQPVSQFDADDTHS